MVVNGRDGSRVDAAVTQIREPCRTRPCGVAADLADAAATDGLLAELPSVDILVNNLGIFGAAPRSRSTTRCGSATSRST